MAAKAYGNDNNIYGMQEDYEVILRDVAAATQIPHNALLGRSGAYVTNLVAGLEFVGVADEDIDNGSGAAGDKSIRTRCGSVEERAVTGATSDTKVGARVYAANNNDLSLTPTATAVYVADVVRVTSSGVALIRFRPVETVHLPIQVLSAATITVGAEAANAINVAVQLLDQSGNEMVGRRNLIAYLSDDANGDSIAAAAADGHVAVGTDGLAVHLVTDKVFMVTSEADGDFDLTITESGADTWYLILVLPDGRLIASGAITFA